MRESIIFLKYNFARFSFGGENDFSMMLSIDEVRRVKRYGDICLYKNTEVKFSFFFLSGYVLAKIYKYRYSKNLRYTKSLFL